MSPLALLWADHLDVAIKRNAEIISLLHQVIRNSDPDSLEGTDSHSKFLGRERVTSLGVSNGLCEHLRACEQRVYFCEHEQ